MLFFGHFGITIGLAHAVNRRTGTRVDLRAAGLLAIAPDLLDKPLGLLYPNVFGNHTRLAGHSILASLVLACGLAWYSRSSKKLTSREALVLWAAFLGHDLLDRIWIKDLHAWFWPLMKWPPPHVWPPWLRWYHALFDPYNQMGEMLGLSILIYLTVAYGLHRRERFRSFWKKGVLGA